MIDALKQEIFQFIYMGGVRFPSPEILIVRKDEAPRNAPISLQGRTTVGFYLRHTIIHSLLDAVFESENPDLEDKGYVFKYKSLPEQNNYEIAVKETYRILTMLRNVITHNKSQLSWIDERLVCSYKTKRKTPIHLDITADGLSILYGIALMRSKLKGEVDRYHQIMVAAMYNSAVACVAEFKDEYRADKGVELRKVSLDRPIRWERRYRVESPEFVVQGDNLKFSIYDVTEPGRSPGGDEYLFDLDGCEYLVPGEFLDFDGTISKSELECWQPINKVIIQPYRV